MMISPSEECGRDTRKREYQLQGHKGKNNILYVAKTPWCACALVSTGVQSGGKACE